MAVKTTRLTSLEINTYIQQIAEPIMRNAKMLGILKAYNRISFNHDDSDIRWRVRFARNQPSPNPGFPTEVTFNAPVRHKEAVLPWRSYAMGEYIHKVEKLVGRSKATQFPRLVENIVRWAIEDFQLYMQQKVYADGDADAMSIHGLESMFAVGSAIQEGGNDTAVFAPNDNYAGLSTVLGAFGGSVSSGVFPTGVMDPEYCAWSPLIVNYEHTSLQTSGGPTDKWENGWRKAVRYARTWLLAVQGVEPEVMVLHPDLERKARDSTDPYTRLEATAGSKLIDLGIQTLQFEGLEMVADAYCPSKTAYLLPVSKMELRSMQSQLVAYAKTTDVYQADMLMFDFYGNMRYESPAFFAKLKAAT